MRILIYTSDIETGEWARETLEEFGRGMHITVADNNSPDLLHRKWSCIISIGNDDATIEGKLHFRYPAPHGDKERASLRRALWALYRDTLKEMTGARCSCGMYDTCHCH